MQQATQQREAPERISWARAIIFGIGFFLLASLLVGQIPGYVYNAMTSSSLQQFENGTFSLGLICLAGFAIVMIILLLFDPKPVVPPVLVAGVGVVLSVIGLAITFWAGQGDNQFYPVMPPANQTGSTFLPLLGGSALWFQPQAIDLVAVGLTIIFVGLAALFYGVLALREQSNPDRRDLGTTPAVRIMMIVSSLLLIVFLYGSNYDSMPGVVENVVVGISAFLALGAFALRLHYLMRPVRKKTMPGLYAIGALGLAQTGVLFLVLWFVAYPLLAWIHPMPVLGAFLSNCTRETVVPGTCSFSQDAGYIVDALITTNFFVALLAAVAVWKSKRNLVVIGSIVIVGVLGLTTLVMHDTAAELPTAMMVTAGILILATVWTITARNEFAVVGESNLGCLGQWLVMGTCLFAYLAAFAFFSIASFPATETPPNIPSPAAASANVPGTTDAVVMFAICAILGGIQFFFLTRNRYRV